ncbi:unnamed protein product [Withania somnifera]
MSCSQSWPEPIVRVQALSESGLRQIPDRYVKQPADRPCFKESTSHVNNIPLIDLENMKSPDESVRRVTLEHISKACREWGFFHVVNHGVSHELMANARGVWREFFYLPFEEKQKFANSPVTYEGYGSRLGVEKGGKLDWSDYFFLHYLPEPLRDEKKWPCLPITCRKIIAEYGQEVVKLCEKLMKILSINLGLNEDYLHKKFGGDNERGACLRVNFYPKLSNGIYKSVEHRVIVNSAKERVSLAFFYNPGGDIPIKPAEELVTMDRPALYSPTTFNEYRAFIESRDLVENLKLNH